MPRGTIDFSHPKLFNFPSILPNLYTRHVSKIYCHYRVSFLYYQPRFFPETFILPLSWSGIDCEHGPGWRGLCPNPVGFFLREFSGSATKKQTHGPYSPGKKNISPPKKGTFESMIFRLRPVWDCGTQVQVRGRDKQEQQFFVEFLGFFC